VTGADIQILDSERNHDWNRWLNCGQAIAGNGAEALLDRAQVGSLTGKWHFLKSWVLVTNANVFKGCWLIRTGCQYGNYGWQRFFVDIFPRSALKGVA
jgi:hypothetical protein